MSTAQKQKLWSTGQKQKLGFAAILFLGTLLVSSTDYFLVLFVAAFLMTLWALFGSGKPG
jgi:hypothetical protein